MCRKYTGFPQSIYSRFNDFTLATSKYYSNVSLKTVIGCQLTDRMHQAIIKKKEKRKSHGHVILDWFCTDMCRRWLKFVTRTGSKILSPCKTVKLHHSLRAVPVSDFGTGWSHVMWPTMWDLSPKSPVSLSFDVIVNIVSVWKLSNSSVLSLALRPQLHFTAMPFDSKKMYIWI